MSIASELDALANNLVDINAAVVSRGGHPSSTGFSGVATAVENIPGGSPEPVQSSYGVLRYYSETSDSFAIIDFGGCTATVDNDAVYQSFMSTNFSGFDNVTCSYRIGDGVDEWRYRAMDWETMQEVTVDVATADMLSTTGVFVASYQSGAWFASQASTIVDTTSPVLSIALSSQTEYAKLSFTSSDARTIDGIEIIPDRVEGFYFGTVPTSVPMYFLAHTHNLKHLSKMPDQYTTIATHFLWMSEYAGEGFNLVGDYVTTIGNNFICSRWNNPPRHFDSPITLTRVTSVGESFLAWNDTFNSPIDLGVLQSVGTAFMINMTAFDKDLTLPSTLAVDGTKDSFMYGFESMTHTITIEAPFPSNFNPSYDEWWLTVNTAGTAYTSGLKITGTYAQDWKTALPDRTSSPYRKLVVV